jgi:hypothetical protein
MSPAEGPGRPYSIVRVFLGDKECGGRSGFEAILDDIATVPNL